MLVLVGLYFWLVFGHLSRRFERQADVFGSKVVSCELAECPPHVRLRRRADDGQRPGVRGCPSAARACAPSPSALAIVAQCNGMELGATIVAARQHRQPDPIPPAPGARPGRGTSSSSAGWSGCGCGRDRPAPGVAGRLDAATRREVRAAQTRISERASAPDVLGAFADLRSPGNDSLSSREVCYSTAAATRPSGGRPLTLQPRDKEVAMPRWPIRLKLMVGLTPGRGDDAHPPGRLDLRLALLPHQQPDARRPVARDRRVHRPLRLGLPVACAARRDDRGGDGRAEEARPRGAAGPAGLLPRAEEEHDPGEPGGHAATTSCASRCRWTRT